jgi:CMP-N,N'-diacetyllegionaminic acid synthase
MLKYKYAALIPARGGSKGIINKNLRLINNVSLLGHSIVVCHAAKVFEQIIVSTDSSEIAREAQHFGVDVPRLRPETLATDASSTESVISDVLQNEIRDDIHAVMLLQPTSPFRLPNHLISALRKFECSDLDSLLSVTPDHAFHWKIKGDQMVADYDYFARPRRQDIELGEQKFRENGSIYIFGCEGYRTNKNRLFGKIGMFEMEQKYSYEIDTEADLVILKTLMG